MLYRLFLIAVVLLNIRTAAALRLCSGTISADDHSMDNRDIVICGAVTIDGVHTFSSLTIESNGTVTHSKNTSAGGKRLSLTITGDVLILAGGKIDLTGKGYPQAAGPGTVAGNYWDVGGAGHGGAGGTDGYGRDMSAGGACYGSYLEPQDLGSGGGIRTNAPTTNKGTPGGGSIKLVVGGTLTVDGSLIADAGPRLGSGGAGGAGGSIWLTAAALAGSGLITADGCGSFEGGGGGGRIAVYAGSNSFVGILRAKGGGGGTTSEVDDGGAGTVYMDIADAAGPVLTLDNGGMAGGVTEFPVSSTLMANLVIRNKAALGYRRGSLAMHLVVEGNLTVESMGRIDVNGCGHPSGSGPGASSRMGEGAGHGGYGTTIEAYTSVQIGGGVYGSVSEPVDPGSGGTRSGGYAGEGGGAVRLTVRGLLTVDGLISADGTVSQFTNGGAGSGGSIWIETRELGGAGTIRADGGTGSSSTADGGGGRVAVYYDSSTFTGQMMATGGTSGACLGGAGTVYLKAAGHDLPELIVANKGAYGTGVPTPLPSDLRCERLFVSERAVAWMEGVYRSALLHVGTKGTVSHPPGRAGLHLVADEVRIDEGGAVDVTGAGHGMKQGPGAGASTNTYAGGGGYGGAGGRGDAEGALGGATYGLEYRPTELGSGGGIDLDQYGPTGGTGGGAVRLSVRGSLVMNGILRSSGTQAGGGGGSGGSIWVMARELTGTGSIEARGGDGWFGSGGGGGGRIAVYCRESSAFPPDRITAPGGNGYQAGLPGTVAVHGWPATDFDDDGDTDGSDLEVFRLCASGPAVSYRPEGSVSSRCPLRLDAEQFSPADFDRDNDVDQDDFGVLQRCVSGPDLVAAPECAG